MGMNNIFSRKSIAILVGTLIILLSIIIFRFQLIDMLYRLTYQQEVFFAEKSLLYLSEGKKETLQKVSSPNALFFRNKLSIDNGIKLFKSGKCDSFFIVEVNPLPEEKKHLIIVTAQCKSNQNYTVELKLRGNKGTFLVEALKFSSSWRIDGGFSPEL